jgi:hypothetical protein
MNFINTTKSALHFDVFKLHSFARSFHHISVSLPVYFLFFPLEFWSENMIVLWHVEPLLDNDPK